MTSSPPEPAKKATKPAGASRKDFVRTKISLGENIVSVVILLLIVGIGIGVAIEGAHFNPDLYTVRSGSLDATAAPVIGKSQTVLAQAGAPAAAPAPDAATPADKPSTPAAAPSDMAPSDSAEGPAPAASGGAEGTPASAPAAAAIPNVPMDITLAASSRCRTRNFTPLTLFTKKSTAARPLTRPSTCNKLRCRTFSVLAASGSYVDVNEYRFDSPLDAFGMFASERDPQGKSVDFAPDGYSSGMGYFFRQGPVYVQIIASDQKPETLAIATALAQNRAKTLPVDDTGVAGRRELPAAGMVADSVAFVLDNAQGQSSLKNVFQAKYNFEGTTFSFFIMVTPDDSATTAWASFQKFCGGFGKVELLPDVNGAKIFRAQLFGKWKVVYLRDKELGGVFDATDSEKARAFVEQYLQGQIK